MADRAPLESPPAEPQRLQRAAGDPDRGEEVAPAAAHDHISAQPSRPDPKRNGLEQDDASGEYQLPPKPAGTPSALRSAHESGCRTHAKRHDAWPGRDRRLRADVADPGDAGTAAARP